jgi:hypothetical protein
MHGRVGILPRLLAMPGDGCASFYAAGVSARRARRLTAIPSQRGLLSRLAIAGEGTRCIHLQLGLRGSR